MNKTIIEIRKHEDINSEIYYDILFFKNNGDINLVSSIPEKYIRNDILEFLKFTQEKEIDREHLESIDEFLNKKVCE